MLTTTDLKGYPLSLQQVRLWTQFGESQAYAAQCVVRVIGMLDRPVLLKAWQRIVSRHEILRTTFHHVSGMEIPVQVVASYRDGSSPVIELSDLSASGQTAQLKSFLVSLKHRIARQESGSLECLHLLRLSSQIHLLMISLPALCADGPTLTHMVAELSRAYSSDLRKTDEDEEPFQYTEVAAWQDELLLEDEASRQYWRSIDLSVLGKQPLPFGANPFANPSQTSQKDVFEPFLLEVPLEESVSVQVSQMAQRYGVSIQAWLLASFQVVLWRCSHWAGSDGKQDLVIGVACDGRKYEVLAQAFGLYTRFVPLKFPLEEKLPFEQVVTFANEALLEASERQTSFTWESVVPSDTSASSDSTPPFFPICFEYERWPAAFLAGELRISLHQRHCCTERFALKLSVLQVGEDLQLELYADPQKVSSKQVKQLARVLQVLLRAGVEQPMAKVGMLPFLEQDEQTSILAINRAPVQSRPKRQLHQLFEEQVGLQPNQLAVKSRGEQLTYQQLNSRANRLAQVLRNAGVGPNVVAGLCMARSAQMLVGLLAILKAGGAYMPLDPTSPPARVVSQLQNSQTQLLVTQREISLALPEWRGGRTLYFEDLEAERSATQANALREQEGTAEDLAYVIYTSGSTGVPKGAMIRHSSVVNYTQGLCELLGSEPGWQYAMVSTLAADLGNTALFCALASGGCVHVLDAEIVTDTEAMARWAEQHPIDVLKIVPSHLLALLTGERASALLPRRALVLGGEALPASLLERLEEVGGTCQVYNHYGPTETTIGVLVNPLGRLGRDRLLPRKTDTRTVGSERMSVPLGQPIPNVQVYLLDQQMQVVPMGVIGELYVGGAGEALGYMQLPEETAARFVPHPYVALDSGERESAGARLYRTGDLARYNEMGQLEFRGRRDSQVKLRGYRIELGEIEAVLRQHPLVWDCTVQLQEEHLIGYVVPRTTSGLTALALREMLSKHLPEYMVPVQFLLLEALPLTPNGKVDLRRLPKLGQFQDNPGEPTEPQSPLEEVLVGMWKKLLHLPGLGIQDNFFARGGNSLLATRLIAQIRAVLQVELSVRAVFEAPTVAGLAQQVEQTRRKSHGVEVPPLVALPRPEEIPLSFAQQRLWFLDQLEPESTAYLLPRSLRMIGSLQVQALKQSLEVLMRRHESLRTTFQERAGSPVQVIHEICHFLLPVIDLQGLNSERREEEARRLTKQEAQHPCDLVKGPLLRTSLIRLIPQDHVVLLTLHHIITDGWSTEVIVRELTTLYQAFVARQPSPLPALPLQYADYALWQRRWLQGEALERQLAYWRTHLAGIVPLALPTDHPRPPMMTSQGASQSVRLPQALLEGLQRLCQQEGVTLFMALLAAFQVLLARYSGETDIAVGTPIANRRQAEIEGVIGFFVNTLVMRTDLSGNPDFVQLLQRVREVCLGAYTHQDIPFEKVVEELEPQRDLSHSPLFQVMLVLQQVGHSQNELVGMSIEPLVVENRVSKFDLTLMLTETEQGLHATLVYRTDLFEAKTIGRMLTHFQALLAGSVQNPQARLWDLPWLSAAEQEQLLFAWNATQCDYPQDLCLHQFFEQQVLRTPDTVAVIFEDLHVTYHQLNQGANQLASSLQERGIGLEHSVGLCVERSPEMVGGLLGILKAGGICVPLDPDSPQERLTLLLKEAHVSVLLTQEQIVSRLSRHDGPVICLDSARASRVESPTSNRHPAILPDNAAYLIWTSGSTGTPKGVLLTHRSLCNRIHWGQMAHPLSESDRVLQEASYSVDFAIWECFAPLSAGAQVILARPGGQRDIEYQIELIVRHHITVIHLIPSLLRIFLEQSGLERCRCVQQVYGGAEPLPLDLWQRFRQQMEAQFHNVYGPTEASIDSTCWTAEREESHQQAVSIGRPIGNVQVYLLNRSGVPVPIGVPGEIFLGGVGLARGYLGKPELTAERFVPHLWSRTPGARLYRSGDLARYREGGVLEYVGRIDHQVKIRGFRIELGEIEAVLSKHPGIKEGVVQAWEEAPGQKRLVAYLVAEESEKLETGKLRRYLQEHLPDYMIPAIFVGLEQLPQTPNGKVDRRALPLPDWEHVLKGQTLFTPRTAVEKALAAIWAEVLHVKQVGRRSNFFELGGDSILSLQIIARAKQKGLHFTLKQLFQYQTIEQLSQVVQTETHILAEQGLVLGSVPLTPIQHWFFAQALTNPHHWNQALFLQVAQEVHSAFFQQLVRTWLTQHDALRLRFIPEDGGWRQMLVSPDPHVLPFTVIDLSALDKEMQDQAATGLAAQSQASLDLTQGPLLRVVQILRERGRNSLLLIVLHHLAADGVSWRILLEDLQIAASQVERGDAIRLPAKTSSWQVWAEHLVQYASESEILEELTYWLRGPATSVGALPRDFPDEGTIPTVATTQTVSVRLSREETRALLREVPAVLHTQINEVLLTALAQSLAEWTGAPSVLVDLEGHGREDLFADLDVSRTVGWFTSIFPVCLALTGAANVSEALRRVKEQLRAIPSHGVGYGILRYLSPDPTVRERLQALPEALISFNYLGQFDQALSPEREQANWMQIGIAPLSAGPTHHRQDRRPYLLDVTGQVSREQLTVTWSYSNQVHRRSTIEWLANRFKEVLRTLVTLTQVDVAAGLTPSDFPLASLDQPLLDQILQQVGDLGPIEDLYPLSPMQEGLLFHALYAPGSGVYLMQMSWQIHGPLQVEAMQQALQRVIERHAVLRTCFLWQGLSQPLQMVLQHVPLPWTSYDWQELTDSVQQMCLERLMREDRERGFALDTAPLLRLTLVRLRPKMFFLLFTSHHILLDGWSMPLLLAELRMSYQAICQGREPRLAPVGSYRDYIAWLQQPDRGQAERFWRAYLTGFTTPNHLPGQASASHSVRAKLATENLSCSPELTASLREMAGRMQVTLNTLIQGAWAILLSRYCGQNDVVFGATTSGRSPELPGMETMIGLFINTLPVRVQVQPHVPLSEWLRQLQAEQLEARQYETTPLVQIQAWSQIPSGEALFESLLVYQNYPHETSPLDEISTVTVKPLPTREQTHYALLLKVIPGPSVLSITMQYDETHFEASFIARMLRHLQGLMQILVEQPDEPLSALSLLSEEERHQQLSVWNATQVPTPSEIGIHQLFEQQRERTPERIAAVFGDEHVTYGELDRRANQLAHYLQRLGAGPETLVGVCLENSLEVAIGVLGILKAGGVVVPLDPTYPQERLAFLFVDACISLLLTKLRLRASLPENQAREVLLDGDWEVIAQGSTARPECEVDAEHLMYVIYTSGSTGIPKGVSLPHRALVNLLTWHHSNLCKQARTLQFAPLSFDVSFYEMFAAWCSGGTLCMVAASVRREVMGLASWLSLMGVEKVILPVVMLHQLAEEYGREKLWLGSLKEIIATGEQLRISPPLVALFEALPNCTLSNHYGPSESHVVTAYTLAGDPSTWPTHPPIGRPISNTQIYLLDEEKRPVPVGVVGELYIGGMNLARGYFDRPDLTAERFLPHPFSELGGERVYKTGDLARNLPDGIIEYLGRSDHQVKIRGYRVELGEIEAHLAQHANVREVVVHAQTDLSGEKRVVAYLILNQEQLVESLDWRGYLRAKLPDYMVPAAFVVLDALPLTPTGKVDRRALPAPEEMEVRRCDAGEEARTPMEELLAALYGVVLGCKSVGREANFFELGGHSLLATRLVARVRAVLGVEVPLRAVFEAPTVARLAVRVEQAFRTKDARALPPLRAFPRPAHIPLSFAQARLWFLDQFEPGSTTYLLPSAFQILGTFDIQCWEESMRTVIQRHESLRTTFEVRAGEAVQVVHPVGRVPQPLIDLQGIGQEAHVWQARRLVEQEAGHPMTLSTGPLLRTAVVRLAPKAHVLLFTLHHIITDGWSMGVFIGELTTLYQAKVSDKPSPLPSLPIQYADYALWQREFPQGEALSTQLAYWRTQLSDLAPLALPTDHPRPAVQTFRGAREELDLPAALTEGLVALSRQEGVTLFMLLLSAFQVLLMRYSGQSDIAVGTTVANRTRQEIEPLIGCFMNTLVLRSDLSGNPAFRQFLQHVRRTCLEAYAHQDVPFEQLVEELHPARDLSHNPLFQTLFELDVISPPSQQFSSDLSVLPIASESKTAKTDLALRVASTPQGLTCRVMYSTDLFEAETIDRMMHHYQTLLESLVEVPDRPLWTLSFLTPSELDELLRIRNATQADYPRERCFHQLFEEQAARTPNAIAAIFEEQHLTYQEMDLRTNQLAHYLRQRGVGPQVCVGICMQRSFDLLIGLLGIFKAGGAFLPLDPSFPPDRMAYLVQDAQALLLLTQQSLVSRLPTTNTSLFCLDTQWELVRSSQATPLSSLVTALDLAYIIYTSGSTGKPKGVLIPHRGLLNYLFWCAQAYGVAHGHGAPVQSTIAADAIFPSLFAPLLTGTSVHFLPESYALEALGQALQKQGPFSMVKITPSQLETLTPQLPADNANSFVHTLVIGAEALRGNILTYWQTYAPEVVLLNEYGPTETSVGCSIYHIPPGKRISGAVPIGLPSDNVQFYVLDAHLQLLPIGVPGELYIGGDGLAWGYLNRPDLTATAFLPHPFSQRSGDRLYRTGDLVRYLPDRQGNIEFLGRLDHQVKVSGFRVELGEIEALLLDHPAVFDGLVIVREDQPGEKRLVAYVIPSSSSEREPASLVGTLRNYLKKNLPEYMVPATIVPLEALPLTTNGKVDRRALPEPKAVEESEKIWTPEAARTPIEEVVAGLWASVLGYQHVGREENFFELGGHSLLATRLVARVRSVFSVQMPLRAVFDAPTVASFTKLIEQAMLKQQGLSVPPLVKIARPEAIPLSFAQQRLWFLDRLEPGSTAYLVPQVQHIRSSLNAQALDRSLDEMRCRHEILRTTFAERAGQPVQVIHPAAHCCVPIIDLHALAPEKRKLEVQRLSRLEAELPMHLSLGPLWRTTLLRLGPQEEVLLVTWHHIITDGWSNEVLIHELLTLYQTFVAGLPSPLAPLSVQYADYAIWQRGWLQGEVLEAQLDYWERRLGGAPPLALPTDSPRPAVKSTHGATHSFTLSADLSQALLTLSLQSDVTLFMTLLAAFQVFFSRLTGQTDIVVGTDSANRTQLETEGMLGFFVNLLALRTDLSGNPTFREVLGRVREVVLGAFLHQETPFELLVEKLAPDHHLDHDPFVQVLFVLQKRALTGDLVRSPVRSAEQESVDQPSSRPIVDQETMVKFDLALFMHEHAGSLSGAWRYRRDLFQASTIASMVARFQVLLHSLVQQPDVPLNLVEITSDAERAQQEQERRELRENLRVQEEIWFDFPNEHSITESLDG